MNEEGFKWLKTLFTYALSGSEKRVAEVLGKLNDEALELLEYRTAQLCEMAYAKIMERQRAKDTEEEESYWTG